MYLCFYARANIFLYLNRFYARIPMFICFCPYVFMLKFFLCSFSYVSMLEHILWQSVSVLLPVCFYTRVCMFRCLLWLVRQCDLYGSIRFEVQILWHATKISISQLDSKFEFPHPLAIICGSMRGCTDLYDMLDICFYSLNFKFQRECVPLHICFYDSMHMVLCHVYRTDASMIIKMSFYDAKIQISIFFKQNSK